MQRYLILLSCLVLLSACSQLTEQKSHHQAAKVLIKSQSDHRQYHYFVAKNGLKVLLISDKNSKEAAASMNVMVGSGSDPIERQGLAHFLEHMLFLGSKAYPESDGFQQWVSGHGGQHNAFTALNNTNYFFSIKPSAFDKALSQFSHFFIDPLLDKKYIEREKHAVDAEFQAGLDNDSRRQMDVIKSVADPHHPFAKFSVGNLNTLSSMQHPIRPDLLGFFQRYYVANNMALALISPEPLQVMQKQVEKYFSAIRHEKQLSPSHWLESPFDASALPRLVEFQAKKDLHLLSLYFPMPGLSFDGSNSQNVLGHLLGYEGSGSLLAELKKQGLANALSAGTAWQYKNGSAFAISIELTEKGQQQRDKALLMVFQALAVLKKAPIPQRIFNELKQLSHLEFDSKEASTPLHAVMQASNNMQWFAPEHILDAAYYYSQENPQELAELLSRLSVDNLLILASSKNFTADQRSTYYQVPFKQSPIDKTLLVKLKQAKAIPEIYLPAANRFIAGDLSLQEKSDQGPEKIQQTGKSELWYQGLDQFLLPRAISYYSYFSAQHKPALLALYVALLNDELDRLTYPASLAGLDMSLYAHARGITLKVSGFSDKQAVFLQDIVEKIKSADFDQTQFIRVKQQLLRNWQNQAKNPPYERALDKLSEHLLIGSVSEADKINRLKTQDLKALRQFAQVFWQSAYLRAFNTGNLSQQTAMQMFALAENLSPAKQAKIPALAVRRVQSFWQDNISTPNDAVYVAYWQGKNKTLTEQANWLLLAQYFKAPFFNQLRTEKQLGYIVFEQYFAQLTVPGLVFVVQSPMASADKLHREVDLFAQKQIGAVQALSEQDFLSLKQAVKQAYLKPAKNLSEQAGMQWYDLALGFHAFDYKQQLGQALNALTFAQWKDFASKLAKNNYGQYVISSQASPWDNYKKATKKPMTTQKADYQY